MRWALAPENVWARVLAAILVATATAAGVMPAAAAEPAPAAPADPAAGIAFFESKIRPLLVDNCYGCHAADTEQKGSLLLDTKAGLLKGGDTGPAIVPGKPAQSLLVQAIKHQSAHLKMPPDGKLTDEEIATVEQWVTMGAPDPRDGARALTKIEEHLEAAKTHWAFQPVVDPRPASLDAVAGTVDVPPADRRTLIRRASLDLVGMPPTPAEVDAFIADQSPGAYGRLIDRLLADPRYGERWGRHWLDVARYADTGGYFPMPNAWTYRDYVIQAFNQDKPYDRFIQEQLAADLLDAKADPQTLAALGFLTIGWQKDGKIDDDTLDNALDTIGRGLLGLSLSCARCHDHKLEPITTQDYYGLFAVLRSCKQPDIPPSVSLPDSPEVREFREKNLAMRAEAARNSIKEVSDVSHKARCRVGDYLVTAEEFAWKKDVKSVDVLVKRGLQGPIYGWFLERRAAWIEKHPEVFGPFLEFVTKKKLDPQPTLHPLIAQAFATPAETLEEVGRRYNEVFAQVESAWRARYMVRLAMPVELKPDEVDTYLPEYYRFIDDLQPRFIDRLQVLEDELALPDPEQESLRQVLIAKDSPVRLPSKGTRGAALISNNGSGTGLVFNLQNDHPGSPGRPVIFVDQPKPFEGYVFVRGNGGVKGPPAPRRFISVFRELFPDDFPKDTSGRLQLAQAITSPRNPLTPRVIVNRVWAWHFGTPIVGSPSDFGFQGEKPANPPLLDHLAGWFMENGWSLKRLHKYLMLSAAYQRADFPVRPLELEPFRDSVLAVSGRLTPKILGKPAKAPTETRRTVYGYVDRTLLASLYRNFDFPNPTFSAPQRERSLLVPRALILMNSPLLLDSAKALAASITKDHADDKARVTELYRRAFQRPPTDRELQRVLAFMASYPPNDTVRPESLDWQYGYGDLDVASKKVTAFTSIAAFDGKAFKTVAKSADGKSGDVMVDAMGGDVGPGARLSSIRRWIAPGKGTIKITAELTHAGKAEGVVARVISSRRGQLGEWQALANSVTTEIAEMAVEKGETVDFVVSSQTDKDAGPYQWSPSILMPDAEMPGMQGMARRWDARTDFADPKNPPKPLTAFEELCQTVLLSPEFAVID